MDESFSRGSDVEAALPARPESTTEEYWDEEGRFVRVVPEDVFRDMKDAIENPAPLDKKRMRRMARLMRKVKPRE